MCFHEIDERQDDKILLEWVGLHQINPISMWKWDWKKKYVQERQSTSTKSNVFHKPHVTLSFIFPFGQYSGMCTALPSNVGVEAPRILLSFFFFPFSFLMLLWVPLYRSLPFSCTEIKCRRKSQTDWFCRSYLNDD